MKMERSDPRSGSFRPLTWQWPRDARRWFRTGLVAQGGSPVNREAHREALHRGATGHGDRYPLTPPTVSPSMK